MKKKVKLLFLLGLFLFSVGCRKQEQKEGALIEINVEELVALMDADDNLILAIIDDTDSKTQNFVDVLKKYQKSTNNPVYYVDTTNVNFIDQEYINIILNQTIGETGLYIIQDGKVTSSLEIPNNAIDLKNTISEEFEEYDLTALYEIRDTYFEEGGRLLNDGLISTSYSSFYHALPKQEAKEALKNDLFLILNAWESTIQDGNNCTYTSLNILTSNNQLYYRTYNGKCSDFSDEKIKVVLYDYYIKENNIYVKKEKEKNYSVLFTIETINKNELIVKDKKTEYKMKKVEE